MDKSKRKAQLELEIKELQERVFECGNAHYSKLKRRLHELKMELREISE